MNKYFEFTKEEEYILQDMLLKDDARLSEYATKNITGVRRHQSKKYDDYFGDRLRNNFAIDVDKIIHSPLFNRGTDKTQVFSFYHNDDITRRSSHVQLVSRIARIIGKPLGLNLDLIEAIAIGHDIGHTPFGHQGERFLSKLYHAETGRYFNHNVHSIRILDKLTSCNLTFQTLDGILCHNGEKRFEEEFYPKSNSDFYQLDDMIDDCYTRKKATDALRPSTLEGCVVRLSDMIAYLGKDRQDARKVRLQKEEYEPNLLPSKNAEIITYLVCNVIKNSLGKPYIKLDKEVTDAISDMRKENGEKIYFHPEIATPYNDWVKPMMEKLFKRLLADVVTKNQYSPIYLHHINNPIIQKAYQNSKHDRAIVESPVEIAVDFIASMTDDYFVEIFKYLFEDDPLNAQICYVNYFDQRYL